MLLLFFVNLQDTLYSGSISRDQVAEVAVGALLCTEASYKVVEIVARADAPNLPLEDMFAAIKQNWLFHHIGYIDRHAEDFKLCRKCLEWGILSGV